MKTKKWLLITLTVCGVLILGACAKPAAEEAPSPVEEEAAPPVEEVVEMPLAEEDTIPEVEEVVMPEEPVLIPQEEYVDIEQEPDGTLHPDSAAYSYMIRPNDYLTKIAYIEYGNPNEWRRIYSWNRERIGDDPNLIYPYHALQLYKPEEEVKVWDYDYLIHTVTTGETLWSIAGEEYGDAIAWIVIFWDNEELLNSNAGRIKPGMELRIRTALWPDY